VIRWAAAAIVLAFLVRAVSASAIIDAIGATHPAWAAAAFALTLLSQFVVAARLKLLSNAYELGPSLPALFRINLAALFYGMFLPAGNVTAAAVRYYRIARPNEEYSGGAIAIVLDRLAATASLCAVGVAAWLLADPGTGRAALVVMAGSLAVLLLAVAALLGGRATGGIEWLARRLPPRFALARAAARSRELSGATLWGVAALSLLAHLIGVLGYQALAVALGLELSLLTVAWIRSAAMLAAMLPVAIAGLGVRDAALLALLAPYGVPGGGALAFSLSVFAWTIAAVGLLGGILEALGLVSGRIAARAGRNPEGHVRHP